MGKNPKYLVCHLQFEWPCCENNWKTFEIQVSVRLVSTYVHVNRLSSSRAPFHEHWTLTLSSKTSFFVCSFPEATTDYNLFIIQLLISKETLVFDKRINFFAYQPFNEIHAWHLECAWWDFDFGQVQVIEK